MRVHAILDSGAPVSYPSLLYGLDRIRLAFGLLGTSCRSIQPIVSVYTIFIINNEYFAIFNKNNAYFLNFVLA